ncbi:hypothetical protein TWF569_005847 [Orbilia oligospora]|uniref:SAYSvFN domain-containing protein n=1 Tax=Orbilia oligospora TaxID=2813651 RepID=A0A7C8KCA4_ORBOL|nr:hypothetical protein TWF103_005982 [Orbilia oligospora]KAF3109810.1 hypothetical protein TWF102_009081 [Orbilia oligospora]KAF3116885.1 hypothetical protein TWF706_000104 [Orbilia oligospora]KAF3130390.1 hypothetical protein TWF703_008185 [Orbilia oligospora]KAF3142216.1 hypothetical protein TWF594_005578 [Orbilia oligospora]
MSSSKRKDKDKDKSKDKPKKPYHIKRSDLDLEFYEQQQEQKSFSLLFSRSINSLIRSKQFYAYLVLQGIAAWWGLGQVFLCVGILWMMYANTGLKKKEGEKSSWSVFNKGFEAIEGSTDMEAVEREIRSRGLI